MKIGRRVNRGKKKRKKKKEKEKIEGAKNNNYSSSVRGGETCQGAGRNGKRGGEEVRSYSAVEWSADECQRARGKEGKR